MDDALPPATARLIAACRAVIEADPRCPRCEHPRIQRWGSAAGRQRYRCMGCGRTFSDLTGTPLAYLKKLEKWPDFAACMVDCLTVRAAARRCSLHRTTSFHWRHLLLGAADAGDQGPLGGVVAFAEAPYPTRSVCRARMLVARDSAGRNAVAAVGAQPAAVQDLVRTLGHRLAGESVLMDRAGRFAVVGRFARVTGLGFEQPRAADERWAAAGQYLLRFRRWLCRFRGVAAKYLRNYLAWHRFLEAIQRLARPTALGLAELWSLP